MKTVAHAVVELECSQATDGRTHGNKVATSDLESRPRSCMIELVQGLHKRCLHTRFGVSSCSHSQTRVFTRHTSVTYGTKMAASDLERRSRSCKSGLVPGLHIRNLCFEFADCSSCRSRTRVFTSPGWTDRRTDGNKTVVSDLGSRSRSCMNELVQGLHKKCLHTRFGVPSCSHSQT